MTRNLRFFLTGEYTCYVGESPDILLKPSLEINYTLCVAGYHVICLRNRGRILPNISKAKWPSTEPCFHFVIKPNTRIIHVQV